MKTILETIAADPNVSDAFKDRVRAAEAKHTPGPWSTRASRDGSGDIGITAPGVVNVIAECFVAVRSRDERAIDEATANARLIAAAPELLDALRLMLTRFDFGEKFPDDHPISVARAAVADATGAQK